MTKNEIKKEIEKYLKEQEVELSEVLSNSEAFGKLDERLVNAIATLGIDLQDVITDSDAWTTASYYSKSLGYEIVLNQEWWLGDHSESSFYDQVKREYDKMEKLENKLKGLK